MATAVRNCLGVDIGSDMIRVAHLEMTRQGPRVLALLEERIALEPELTEDKRAQALARQLQDMLKRGRIRAKNAIFCIPGQSVFVRRIRLPRANPEQMARMVRYEARQQIPLPLDKTIMEFQVFEEADQKEVNVLLVAIKRDFILNFMKLVRRSGLKAMAITVSSIALYNFHEFNTSGRNLLESAKSTKSAKKATAKGLTLFKKKADAAAAVAEPEEGQQEAEFSYEEIQAYVNIGASLTDLAIPKPGQARMIGFTRSVPLAAGNEMDRVIREKLGLADLNLAREVKESQVAVLSAEAELEAAEAGAEVNTKASEAATAVADRLIAELRRSLDFYISQPDGVAVDGLVLSGGLARLRHLAGYVEEKIGLPVTLAEPRHEQLRLPDEAPENFSSFVVAMGLALQGLGLAQNQIDFLPEEIKTVRGLQDRKLEVGAMLVMLLAMIGLSFNIGSAQIAELNAETRSLDAQIGRYRENDVRIAESMRRHEEVRAAVAQVVGMTTDIRTYQMDILVALMERRPPEMLVDNLVFRTDGIILMSGWARNNQNITSFIMELGELKDFIYEAKLHMVSPPMRDPAQRFNTAMVQYSIYIKTFYPKDRLRMIGERPLAFNPPPPSVGQRVPFGGRR